MEIKIFIKDKTNLNSSLLKKAIFFSLMRAKTTVIAAWSRAIQADLMLPSATIKGAFSGAINSDALTIKVTSSQGTPLAQFNPQPTATGVSVHVTRSRGRQEVRHAFMRQGKVFRRVGRPRLPIDALYTTDVEDKAKDTLPQLATAYPKVAGQIAQNIRFYLSK